MKKIVSVLKPFAPKQKLFIYDEDNKVTSFEVEMANLNEVIFNLTQEHNIDTVDLTGPKSYLKGIVKQLKDTEIKKYNKNSITFNII